MLAEQRSIEVLMPDAEGSSGNAGSSEESALGVDLGSIIARKYRVDRFIGKGGMGVVVAASHLALNRTVAIKLIRADCAQNPVAVERMVREAKAAAVIKNEHVTQVLDVGTLDSGAPFIVMEYLEGCDLQTLLARDGPLPVADAVDFVLQACEAIAEAHRNGIVHRDIKPANLFLARLPGGMTRIKVVDFGISKMIGVERGQPLTQPCTVVGSLYHMAPEQMRGALVDARTDVWAIGVLLYEMVTGQKPFRDQSWPAVCAHLLNDAAPLLAGSVAGMSQELQPVIERCLRRLPEDRFENVAELAVALSRFGTRKAHVSLERIVGLATSTGSLSARAGAAPDDRDERRPSWRGMPNEPGGAAASRHHTPRTPWPVSTIARTLSGPSWGPLLALGVAAALCVLVPAVLWLWRSPPAVVDGGSAALRPLPPVLDPVVSVTPMVEVRAPAAEAAASSRPSLPDPLNTVVSAARAPSASAGPEPAPDERAAGAPAPDPPSSARAAPPTIAPIPPHARRPGAAPANPGATPEATAPAPGGGAMPGAAPGAGTVPGHASQGEPPTTPGVSATPSAPPKASPANPWDLGDIEFQDEGRQ
jgi:eukaryotic-like serine/threonine-protein kinase